MTKLDDIPMFSKEDYEYWKIRMEVYLAALDDDLWDIITDGPIKIMKVNIVANTMEGTPQMTEKPKCEWTTKEKRKANLDNVDKNILYNSLD